MRSRSIPGIKCIRSRVAAAGLGLALIVGGLGLAAVQPVDFGSDPVDASPAVAYASEAAEEVRTPYVNATQGYSLLRDSSLFGINEQNDGAGQTVFYLIGSKAETSSVYGSLYTVFYDPTWDGSLGIDQFFEQLVNNVRTESGDSFTPVTAGAYEYIELAGVRMPAAAWYRTSPDSGYRLFELRALEELPGGGAVVWSMSVIDEEADVVLKGLTEAAATFRTDPAFYNGTNPVRVSAASLATRSGTGAGSAGTSTGSPTDSQNPPTSSASTISYTPVQYTDGWSYTINVPQGWTVVARGGAGTSAIIDAYDPQNPAVRMMYVGTQNYPGTAYVGSLLGLPFTMGGPTVADYVQTFPAVSEFAVSIGDGAMPQVARVSSVEIIDIEEASTLTDQFAQFGMGGIISDEAVVTARMTLMDGNDTPIIGAIYAVVIPVGYGDLATYSVQNIYGIYAPADMFYDVSRAIVESGCGQFTVTDAYIQAQLSAGSIYSPGTGGSTYDPSAGIMDSWYYQQEVSDNAFQAWDDYILGRDRYQFDDGSELLVYYE